MAHTPPREIFRRHPLLPFPRPRTYVTPTASTAWHVLGARPGPKPKPATDLSLDLRAHAFLPPPTPAPPTPLNHSLFPQHKRQGKGTRQGADGFQLSVLLLLGFPLTKILPPPTLSSEYPFSLQRPFETCLPQEPFLLIPRAPPSLVSTPTAFSSFLWYFLTFLTHLCAAFITHMRL